MYQGAHWMRQWVNALVWILIRVGSATRASGSAHVVEHADSLTQAGAAHARACVNRRRYAPSALRADHPDKVIVQLFGLRAAAAMYKRRLIQQRAYDRCVGLLETHDAVAEGIVQHFVA